MDDAAAGAERVGGAACGSRDDDTVRDGRGEVAVTDEDVEREEMGVSAAVEEDFVHCVDDGRLG